MTPCTQHRAGLITQTDTFLTPTNSYFIGEAAESWGPCSAVCLFRPSFVVAHLVWSSWEAEHNDLHSHSCPAAYWAHTVTFNTRLLFQCFWKLTTTISGKNCITGSIRPVQETFLLFKKNNWSLLVIDTSIEKPKADLKVAKSVHKQCIKKVWQANMRLRVASETSQTVGSPWCHDNLLLFVSDWATMTNYIYSITLHPNSEPSVVSTILLLLL